MKYTPISNTFFKQNRQKLASALEENSLVIVNSNDMMPRNGDQFYKYRQNSDLFYLSGIEQEETILVMFPGHPVEKYREILFVQKTTRETKLWEGAKLSKGFVREISGVQSVFWLDSFEKELSSLMALATNVYLNLNENPRFSTPIPYKDVRFAQYIKSTFPLHEYKRLAPIITSLRLIKDEEEIDLLQHACDITEKAFFRVLKFVKPGTLENEVEAEITHEFIKSRASGHAFHPIVASGANSCVLHYTANENLCEGGDLLLLDFGAEYANYSADCSRTIPVSGRFTPRQRECYESTLNVFRQSMELLKPGTTLNELQEKVLKLWEKEHVNLGLYSEEDLARQDPAKPLVRKYFPHGVSHFLGLDTHDVGDKSVTLQPGMVVTCEPGIYIEDEQIGIRLENDILITETEPLDLMENIPIEAYDIEKLMTKKED